MASKLLRTCSMQGIADSSSMWFTVRKLGKTLGEGPELRIKRERDTQSIDSQHLVKCRSLPSSLLLLSRAFTVTQPLSKDPHKESAELEGLKDTLSSLPREVIDEIAMARPADGCAAPLVTTSCVLGGTCPRACSCLSDRSRSKLGELVTSASVLRSLQIARLLLLCAPASQKRAQPDVRSI